MPWAPEDGSAPGTVANALPYTLEWAAFPVNAVITARDTYDFTKVDALLDAITSRGHRGVIRFYLDYPGRTTGMPHYLLNAGTDKSRQYDLHGNNEISFSPNDDEPAVQEMMLRFVAALGEKYDGDPRIGYITAGLYGFWGEEHTWPYNGSVSGENPKGANWMPSDAFRARPVKAWDEAFDDTFIQNRYPTAATKAHGMGYFDDSLGYATLEGTSWHFLPTLKEQGEAEAWKIDPIGGELLRGVGERVGGVHEHGVGALLRVVAAGGRPRGSVGRDRGQPDHRVSPAVNPAQADGDRDCASDAARGVPVEQLRPRAYRRYPGRQSPAEWSVGRLRERHHGRAASRIPGSDDAEPRTRAEELTTRPGPLEWGPGLSLHLSRFFYFAW